MSISTVTSKGQITIPITVRKRLDLNPGDKVNFFITDSGVVVFQPAKKEISELKGIIPKPEKPVTLEDIEQTIKTRGAGL